MNRTAAKAGSEPDVTSLLRTLGLGDARLSDELMPLVYGELRKLAKGALRRNPAGESLGPTVLVHEAWLRLAGKDGPSFASRQHFFFAAARAMHDILVERARRNACERHGGGLRRVDVDSMEEPFAVPPDEMIALNAALDRLGRDDERKRCIVELRFFAGLTSEEAATVLGISLSTFEREWRYVRARLRSEL